MPQLRHDESQYVALPQVAGVGEVRTTQDSVAYGGNHLWDTVQPQEPVGQSSQGSILTWQVPSSSSMTDLNESFIRIEMYWQWYNNTGGGIQAIGGLKNEGGRGVPLQEFTTVPAPGTGDVFAFANGTGTGLRGAVTYITGDAGREVLVTLSLSAVNVPTANHAGAAAINTTAPPGSIAFLPTAAAACDITFENGGATVGGTFTIAADGSVVITSAHAVAAGPYSLQPFSITYHGYDTRRYNVTVPPAVSLALFNSVSLEMNGAIVYPSQGVAQPYAALANVLKNEPAAEREAGELDRGYIFNQMYEFDEGSEERRFICLTRDQDVSNTQAGGEAHSQAQKVTFTVRLADIAMRTNGTWLPPDTQLRIRARRCEDLSLIQRISDAAAGDADWTALMAAANNFSVQISSADLYVARKTLKPHVAQRMAEAWPERPLTVPFEAVRTFTSWHGVADTTVNVVGALAGPTPTCVYAFFVSQAGINGTGADGKSPLFACAPDDGTTLSNVSLSIGGARTYPVHPYQGAANTRFPGNVAQLYQMYRMTANGHPFLRSQDMAALRPVCFQIGTRGHSHMDSMEDVSVQFKATLSAPQAAAYCVVLVSFTDSTLELDVSGRVDVV